jgi:branched-chain amino acid aminotransferase
MEGSQVSQVSQVSETRAAAEGSKMKIWLDGEIVDAKDAKISVLDHGLLYGDGLFEGIRIYASRVFRLDDHLRRLQTGAKAIGLEIPGGVSEVEKIVLDTARAYGEREAYIRLVVTRGVGALGVDPLSCHDPKVICIATSIALYSAEKLARGLDMVTASLRRPGADVLDPAVKSLNYLNNVLAKREAVLQGADEALLLNARGHVAEASVANVFMVRDGVLSTPLVSDGALPGITRASVLEIAAELGIAQREQTLGRFDLLGADEMFLTGSGARIAPVRSLDGQPIGRADSGRPVTQRIDEAFAHFVESRGTAF